MMTDMWISYNDREVEKFHPACAEALNLALANLGLSDTYRIEHHRRIGTLETDLVISNIKTNRILCVIEVKRTIDAVMSTRFQHQAMSYVQELRDVEKESPYYILTNLEATAFFRFDNSRQKVSDQMLSPGIMTIARFTDFEREPFIQLLGEYFAQLIKRILNNDTSYFINLSDFAAYLSSGNGTPVEYRQWNTTFAILAYEYIRGAMARTGRNELLDIRRLHNHIKMVCSEALRVNFGAIFGLPEAAYAEIPPIPSAVLSEIYDLGNTHIDADSVSDIIHNIITNAKTFPGEVPTDVELARALMIIGKGLCNELTERECICDPAAGSGNLLAVAPEIFPGISPRQLIANDINPYLPQLLSLRLGLKFPTIISPQNCPTINCSDITDLSPGFFSSTRLIVLNPPFYSHNAESCGDWKESIYRRIENISGSNAITRCNKMALEGAFLELVSEYATAGTVMACIIPRAHIVGQGISSQLFRKFLLTKFGIKAIFSYPQSNIFESVKQNTCIVVGIKGESGNAISYISSSDNISDIDYEALGNAITDLHFCNRNGISRQIVDRASLERSVETGWQHLDKVTSMARELLGRCLTAPRFGLMKRYHFRRLRRGGIGNSGGSDLIYPKSSPLFFNAIKDIASEHMAPAIRTVQQLNDPYLADNETCFLDVSGMTDSQILEIATIYKTSFEPSQGNQPRQAKTAERYAEILKSESSRAVPAGSVFIGRDTRRKGKAYFCDRKLFPSTNVYSYVLPPRTAKFLHSWFCSIFYQLDCELVAKNHAGARKMDKAELGNSIIPIIEQFTEYEADTILCTPVSGFLTLNDPAIREIDIAWAKIIDPCNWDTILNEARRYLMLKAMDRES